MRFYIFGKMGYSFLKTKEYVILELRNKSEMVNQLQNPLYELKSYLRPGKYYVIRSDGGKLIAYNKDKNTESFISRFVFSKSKTKTLKYQIINLIDKLLLEARNIKLDKIAGTQSKAQLLMVTYNREYKLFDFYHSQVLNIVSCSDTFAKLKNTVELFNKHFNIPIKVFCDNKKIFSEELIEYIPYNSWSIKQKDLAVDCIFSNYNSYFSGFDNKYSSTNSSALDLYKNIERELEHKDLRNYLMTRIESQKESNWCMIRCHGDMVFSNILLYKDKYYFIDWVDSGEYVFFYDLINFMFGEAAFHNNYYYIKNFIEGDYDHYFQKTFSIFNVNFNDFQKLFYICLFVIERIKFRLNNKKDQNFNNVLNTYFITLVNIEKLIQDNNKSSTNTIVQS